jgi:predicted ribosome quality control (RQC) complex YloA/Tae2 family protein
MGLLTRIRRWVAYRRDKKSFHGHLRQLEQKLRDIEAARLRLSAEISLAKIEAAEDLRRVNASMTRLQEIAERSEAIAKKQAATIEAMQDQLNTANDLTIPTLVAAHQLVLHRLEQDSQVLALRRGAMAAARDEGT